MARTVTEIEDRVATERPIRVLHVLDHSLPLHSGYSFRTHRILQSQRRRGWIPSAVTSPKHEASSHGDVPAEETLASFRYYRSGRIRPGRFPLDEERRIIEALTRRIDSVVRSERPDLLHAHSPVLNAVAALRAGRRHDIPVVYEIRAFWEDAAVDHGTYGRGSWKYRMVRAIESWACRRADAVAVLCRGIQEDLVKRGIDPAKTAVIYNGIDPDETRIGEPDAEYRREWNLEGKKVVGFIGSFYGYEGLDLLVDAMPQLRSRNPDVVLLLVGGGGAEAAIRERIRALALEPHVILPGRIPHERIPGVYALVDVLAYPRHATRTTELVTPLKPLESMAMGKAFVASDVGGHRELIQDGKTGLLFPAENVAALAEALHRLLTDHALREEIQRQQVPWVRREHSWDRTTAPYSALYARALARPRRRPNASPR